MNVDHRLLRLLGYNTQGDLGPWTFYTSRRRQLVFFLRAPPKVPASQLQNAQRNKFRLAANLWNELTPADQNQWEIASKRSSSKCTGYDIFVWWVCRQDNPTIETLQRNTRTQLVPLPSTTL